VRTDSPLPFLASCRPQDRDVKADTKAAAIKRNEFAPNFGKQDKPKTGDREQAEENHKRMRFVSEKKPAMSTAKAQKYGY
jgi:hypothetical protein